VLIFLLLSDFHHYFIKNIKKMEIPHCSVNYHNFGFSKLLDFSGGVKLKIYANDPPFTSPPLTEMQLNTLIENFHLAHTTYKNQGKLFKAEFIAAKNALLAGLDSIAAFIEGLTGVDEEMISLGGYTPTKTTDSEATIPDQTAIPELERGGAGEIFAHVPPVEGAEDYGCFAFANQPMPAAFTFMNGQIVIRPDNSPTPPGPQPGPLDPVFIHDVSKSRFKHFQGLKPGVTYYFYFYAVNAAGVSILSAVRSMMATD
jgi:hypothetical protein